MKLIPGRIYKLKNGCGEFCHSVGMKGRQEEVDENVDYMFIGEIPIYGGRNIFYGTNSENHRSMYVMFSCNKPSDYATLKESNIEDIIENLNNKINENL